MPETSFVEQEDYTLPGSLRRDRVLSFVGCMAVYCHDVVSRALAISILEKTLQADLPVMQDFDEADKKVSPTANEWQLRRESPRNVDGLPTTRHQKRLFEAGTNSPTMEKSTATTTLTPPRKPDRLWQFLAAGGLKVLDQWVEDASREVPGPKAPPGSRGKQNPTPQESPTGALLLPILILLRDLPFDKQLVKQSKINRRIRTLSKDIDALAEKTKSEKTTHPRAGGYAIKEVQTVLDDLKTTWNEQQNVELKERPSDPFQTVQEALHRRLDELKDYQMGKISQPQWLTKAWEEEAPGRDVRAKKKRRMSTEEMNRIDHQRERSLRIKEDLQKAAQERKEYQLRLREIKLQHAAQQKQMVAGAPNMVRSSGRKVHWKDGVSHVSTGRDRAALEEVFVFYKGSSSSASSTDLDSSNNLEDVSDKSLAEAHDEDLALFGEA